MCIYKRINTDRESIGIIKIGMALYEKYNLRIGSLNIEGGLHIKAETSDIQNIVKDHDIFIFLETWLERHHSCPAISGYSVFRSERKRHVKAKRNSGGLAIYYKQNLAKGIVKMKQSSQDIIWLQLQKHFFGLETDIYLCAAYIVPDSSPFAADRDVYEDIIKDIEHFTTMGNVALIGDLNSRLGISQERHYGVDYNDHVPDIIPEHTPRRSSKDKVVNANGRKLLQLLTNHDMLVANGRVCGDLNGNFTCRKYNGDSVVDMFITQSHIFGLIDYLYVAPFDWYSDHSYVSVSIQVNLVKNQDQSSDWAKMVSLFQNWNCENKSKFCDLLCSPEVTSKLNVFCETQFASSNDAARVFTDIVSDVIARVFPKRKSKDYGKSKRTRESYSPEIQIAKRAFRRSRRNLDNDVTNIDRRQQYLRDKKRFKKLVYISKKCLKEKQVQELVRMQSQDQKRFWGNLKRMISPSENVLSNIQLPEWFTHFKSLLSGRSGSRLDTEFLTYVKHSLSTLEDVSQWNESLNAPVTRDELIKTVKSLKAGKA